MNASQIDKWAWRNLYLLGTGTGLAPFLSLVRDPEIYEYYDRIVLAHSCRKVADLAYSEFLQKELVHDALVGPYALSKFTYFPTVTREPFRNWGRLTDLVTSGRLFEQLELPEPDPVHDRFMLCGSQDMLTDFSQILLECGFFEGNHSEPGSYVVDRAFVG